MQSPQPLGGPVLPAAAGKGGVKGVKGVIANAAPPASSSAPNVTVRQATGAAAAWPAASSSSLPATSSSVVMPTQPASTVASPLPPANWRTSAGGASPSAGWTPSWTAGTGPNAVASRGAASGVVLPGAAAAAAAATSMPPAMSAPSAEKKPKTLRISSRSGDNSSQNIVASTLAGDFVEKGENHGRKYFYKTTKIAGHEHIEVYLYYWDDRDGTEFSGWWFGDQVGGSQVWARSPDHGPSPPKDNWLVPWDAKQPTPGALVIDEFGGDPVAGAAPSKTAAEATSATAAVNRATVAAGFPMAGVSTPMAAASAPMATTSTPMLGRSLGSTSGVVMPGRGGGGAFKMNWGGSAGISGTSDWSSGGTSGGKGDGKFGCSGFSAKGAKGEGKWASGECGSGGGFNDSGGKGLADWGSGGFGMGGRKSEGKWVSAGFSNTRGASTSLWNSGGFGGGWGKGEGKWGGGGSCGRGGKHAAEWGNGGASGEDGKGASDWGSGKFYDAGMTGAEKGGTARGSDANGVGTLHTDKKQSGWVADMTPAEKLQITSEKVDFLDTTTHEVLAAAKQLLEREIPEDIHVDVLQNSVTELQQQQAKLGEVQAAVVTETSQAKKAGEETAVAEYQQLGPRLRTLQTTLAVELNKVRSVLVKARSKQEQEIAERRRQEEQAALKVKEEEDAKAFEVVQAAAQAETFSMQAIVDAVVAMASPLIADPPEEEETLTASLVETEVAATDGLHKLAEARISVNDKVMGCREYAPEAKKIAMQEMAKLTANLVEMQKILNSYKAFRKDFKSRVEARRQLAEVMEKLSSAESYVEKVTEMSKPATSAGVKLSEEDVAALETATITASQEIAFAMQLISQKAGKNKGPQTAIQEECDQMRCRAMELKRQLEDVANSIRAQRERLNVQQVLAMAVEKAEKAERAMESCAQAEAPFQTSVKDEPGEELAAVLLCKADCDKAFLACETAGAKALQEINNAKAFMRQKRVEAKRYLKEVSDSMQEQLQPLSARVDAAEAKLKAFRAAIADRRMSLLLQEATAAVKKAEVKVEDFAQASAIFTGEGPEKAELEALKEAFPKSAKAAEEAQSACAEARRIVHAKQREARDQDSRDYLAKALSQVNAVQDALLRNRAVVEQAKLMVKIREVSAVQELELSRAENAVSTIQALSDADPQTVTEQAVRDMDSSLMRSEKALRALPGYIQPLLRQAPGSTKASLQNLMDRAKDSQERLVRLKFETKEIREKAISQMYLEEVEEKAKVIDAAVENMAEVELPFLKGIEVLPLQEAAAAIAASEAAAEKTLVAIKEARHFIAEKGIEARGFSQAQKVAVTEGFAKITERVNVGAQKLGAFQKDTEIRKRTAQVQEAGAKILEVEDEVKRTVEVAAPFLALDSSKVEAHDGDNADNGLAQALQKFLQAEKETIAEMTQVRMFVQERQRVSRGNAEHAELLKKYQARLTDAQNQLTKAKQATTDYEHQFIAKQLLAEAKEQVFSLEADLKKATDVCAPLSEHGGQQWLVETSLRAVAEVLLEYMEAKDLSEEALFKEASGSDKVSEADFFKYFDTLPQRLKRQDLILSDERRAAIWRRLVSRNPSVAELKEKGSDSAVNMQEFQSLFKWKFHCLKSISVTDRFEIADARPIGKAEAGDTLMVWGLARKDESGMLRQQCTLANGKSGWVTVKGITGIVYVEYRSPWKDFSDQAEEAVARGITRCNEVSSFLNAKVKERSGIVSGPLAAAKVELNGALKTKVHGVLANWESLRKKLKSGIADYKQMARMELTAHTEAREKREAEAIMSKVVPKVDAAESAAKAIEDAAKAMMSLEGEDLEEFATPCSVLEEVERLAVEVQEKVEEATQIIREQLQAARKASPATKAMGEAKRELAAMQKKAENAGKLSKRVFDIVCNKCNVVSSCKRALASKHLRDDARERHLTADKLFEELAEGKASVTEAAFCAKLTSWKGVGLKAEQAKLLVRSFGGEGIRRLDFLRFMQLYYTVTRDIALTTGFDVGSCKTLRKAEKDEILEVIEGPTMDENIGITRARAKSLSDGIEYWVSVKGNQGTPFLKEVQKPFYICRKQVGLQSAFESEGREAVRQVEEDEVLELIEGPKSKVLQDALRARIKTHTDGATGWITIKDRNGMMLAEANPKLHVCTVSVAMTDGKVISDCKVIRRLAVGEVFEVVGDVAEDADAGVERVHGRALQDGQAGWITTKGNAGTVYAEATSKYWSLLQQVELHSKFRSEGAEVGRVLNVGEVFQVLEGPRTEAAAPQLRAKVRCARDGQVGWIGLGDSAVKPWKGFYTCLAGTPIHEDRAVAPSNKVFRDLLKGEVFEVMEGPLRDGEALRARGKAKKDGVTGWVTIKDAAGKRLLDC